MASIRSLCVYCGSRTGRDPEHRALAADLGRAMAERGVELVYGGGRIGLMGVVADAVLAGGGRVTGIIPGHLHAQEVGNEAAGELIVVDSMHVRKQMMFERADAFVALPGGFGTLDETVEILTWRQLRLHDKPLLLLARNGYWQPLLALFRHFVDSGFAGKGSLALYQVAEDVEEAFRLLHAAPAPRLPEHPERL